jgi:hypothetical protein
VRKAPVPPVLNARSVSFQSGARAATTASSAPMAACASSAPRGRSLSPTRAAAKRVLTERGLPAPVSASHVAKVSSPPSTRKSAWGATDAQLASSARRAPATPSLNALAALRTSTRQAVETTARCVRMVPTRRSTSMARCEANASPAWRARGRTTTTRAALNVAKAMRQRTAFARPVSAAQSRNKTIRVAWRHISALPVPSVTQLCIRPGVELHSRVQIAR